MKFLADAMLGKLAKWLRILGYDVTYWKSPDPDHFFLCAREEGRTILTKNRRLPKEAQGLRVLLIESDFWREQVAQVVRAFRLRPGQARYRRCLLCNRRLLSVPKERVQGKVPDFVYVQQESFHRCPQCGRVYWQGSHLSAMTHTLSQILSFPAPRGRSPEP